MIVKTNADCVLMCALCREVFQWCLHHPHGCYRNLNITVDRKVVILKFVEFMMTLQ